MNNTMAVMLLSELYRISLHICVRFVITKVYIPLANVLHLMIYSLWKPTDQYTHPTSESRRTFRQYKGHLNI
jgi:hypothetical protein